MKACKVNEDFHIVVVGGGTAGWLTACLLAADHGQSNGKHYLQTKTQGTSVRVTLVESPNIASIGVGEGTWPSMRSTLQRIGISEKEFLLRCNASFKQGSCFQGWRTGDSSDWYYHPFSLPEGYPQHDHSCGWLPFQEQVSFTNALSAQGRMCDLAKAPKTATTPDYAFALNYGYHLDAGKFADLLTEHGTQQLNIQHIRDDVVKIVTETGQARAPIQAITTQQNGAIKGDLFIDCTGFKGLLIEQHFQVERAQLATPLLNDRAVAMQVPYVHEQAPIASATLATALSSGWIWDIGLPTRRGVGMVYSSAFLSADQAELQLRKHIDNTLAQPSSQSTVAANTAASLSDAQRAAILKDITARHITLSTGIRKTFWVENCVAVGLSAGFIEPLEASAIALIETSASFISDNLPLAAQDTPFIAKRFNQTMTHHWHRIIDFLKLHYVLSQRSDSDYWYAQRQLDNCSDWLRENLQLWQRRSPNLHDLSMNTDMFPAASWQYIWFGMQQGQLPFLAAPPTPVSGGSEQVIDRAQLAFQRVANKTRSLAQTLPSNRELLAHICQ